MSIVSASAHERLENKNRFYTFVDGGVRGFLSQSEVIVSATSAQSAIAADFDAGYMFGVGFGLDTGSGFRPELAVSYSKNKGEVGGFREVLDVDGILQSTEGLSAGFDVSTLNVLTKWFLDWHLKSSDSFVPYVGIQLGYSRVKIKFDILDDDSENYFVYGGISGFRYLLNDNFSVGLESSSLIYYDSDDPATSYSLKARIDYSF